MRKAVVISRSTSAYHGDAASAAMNWLLKEWSEVPADEKNRATLVVRSISDGVMIGFEWREPQLVTDKA